MRALTIAAAICALFAQNSLASPLPPRKAPVSSLWSSPLAPILKWSVDDIAGAIKLANAANPPDTDAATCYGALLEAVQTLQTDSGAVSSGPTLATDFERLRLVQRSLSNLKTTAACKTVCFDATAMLAFVGAPVSTFCTVLTKIP